MICNESSADTSLTTKSSVHGRKQEWYDPSVKETNSYSQVAFIKSGGWSPGTRPPIIITVMMMGGRVRMMTVIILIPAATSSSLTSSLPLFQMLPRPMSKSIIHQLWNRMLKYSKYQTLQSHKRLKKSIRWVTKRFTYWKLYIQMNRINF